MENSAGQIGIFLIAGIVMISIPLILNWLLAPRSKDLTKTTYECGEDPIGLNRLQFKVHYFLTAIVFLVFEVEIIFLLPWAVSVEQFGINGLIIMAVFLGILTFGLIYAIVKKALKWQ